MSTFLHDNNDGDNNADDAKAIAIPRLFFWFFSETKIFPELKMQHIFFLLLLMNSRIRHLTAENT